MFRKAGTFPCTAAGAPSCPRQSLSEPCPVSLIPNLIGFQGDVTGVSPGAKITCSVLLIASLPCTAEAAGHSSVPLSSQGHFHSQPVPCPSTDPRVKQLLQMLEGLDTPSPRSHSCGKSSQGVCPRPRRPSQELSSVGKLPQITVSAWSPMPRSSWKSHPCTCCFSESPQPKPSIVPLHPSAATSQICAHVFFWGVCPGPTGRIKNTTRV